MKKTITISATIYTCIFLGLTTNLNSLSFYNKEYLSSEQIIIQKKYDDTLDNYDRLCNKQKKLKQKKLNKPNLEAIENLNNSIEDLKEEVVANFKELIELEAAPEVRHKACLYMAELRFNEKRYGCTKKYLNKILHTDAKNDIQKKYLTYFALARAHLRNSNIYKELVKNEEDKDKSKWYFKKIAFHNERAKKNFEKIVQTKAIDIPGKIKIDKEDQANYEEKMLDCAFDAANYALKYIKDNDNATKEKIEKYKNFAEQYFTEIIDYVNEKNKKKIETDLLNNKIEALIHLADLYIDYKLETNNAKKVLSWLEEAKSLTLINIKKLYKIFSNKEIENSLESIKKSITKVEKFISSQKK